MTTSQQWDKLLAVWGEAQNMINSFVPHYSPITVPYLRAAGILPHFNTLLSPYAYDNFTVEQWVAGVGFQNPTTHQEALDQAVEAGFLTENNGAYTLTTTGREGVAGFFSRAADAMRQLNLLTPDETHKVLGYFKRIVEATEATELPFGKFHFNRSRVTDPKETGGVISQIDQFVTDLQFYRDDAHNSAWRSVSNGISPTAWNALSQIWAGTATTAEKIAEVIEGRGYDSSVYANSLEELAQQGWVEAKNGEYHLTAEGKHVREQAEYETNRIFFAGWDFTEEELTELENLSKALSTAAVDLARRQTWDLMVATTNAYTPLYGVVTQPYFQATGFQNGDWGFLLDAWGIEPTPFNSELVQRVGPYRNPATLDDMIKATAERGFLHATDGGYQLTPKGRDAVQGFFKVAYDHMGRIETLAEDRLEGLVALLKRISDHILAMVEGNTFTKIGHVSINEAQTGPNPRIDQYLTEFLYWRDDAHIAAWRPSGLDGRTFEMFSFIWRNEANTAAAMVEARGQARAYTMEDYQAAIDTLVEKGWVKAEGEGYVVTEAGQKVREDIEKKTDEIFFSAWNPINPFELGQMKAVLGELHAKLMEMQPEAEAENA